MTTIAYKDGIMVADTRAWTDGANTVGQKIKIRRLTCGTLVGAASNVVGGVERLHDWWDAGCPEGAPLPKSFTCIAVAPDGTAHMMDDVEWRSGPLTAKYFAIGSGARYAIALMEYGCTAEQAVRIACRLDIYSEQPLCWANHGDGPHIY